MKVVHAVELPFILTSCLIIAWLTGEWGKGEVQTDTEKTKSLLDVLRELLSTLPSTSPSPNFILRWAILGTRCYKRALDEHSEID